MGNSYARLARPLSVVSALLFALAAPAFASAATFSNESPTNAVSRQPQLVGTTAFSSAALRSGTQQISIDGVAIKTLINTGSTSGYWSASEVWDAAKQAYVIKWTWVKSATSPNKATIYAYPTAVLGDGQHSVVATIKDTAGVTSSDYWSFTLGVAPVLGTPSPAAGSTASTLTPAITVSVTDNDPRPMSATATVNGAAATAAVSSGVVSVTSPKLPNDSLTTVTVTVTDASGNKASKTWSFTVLSYPDMFNSVAECNTCHPDAATDNDMADDCSMCHDGQIDTPHQGTPASLHTNTDSSCTPCHVTELTNEHARWLSKAGTPISCFTCHTSTNPQVIAAIALGDAQCSSCHDATNPHQGIDMSATHSIDPLTAGFTIQGVAVGTHACTDCHDANVVSQHGGDCAACHPTAAGEATPWDNTCASVGCHTPSSSVPVHTALDSAHNQPALTADCSVSGCHNAGATVPFVGRSIADIHSVATTTVAGVTRTSCTICHRPGVTATNNCLTAGCHSERANPHGYDAAKHLGTPAEQSFSIGGATYPAIPCSSCHNTELGVEHAKPTSSGNTGCSECHPTLLSRLPQPWDKTTCAQGSCHTASSAAPMHGSIGSKHARLSANDACFASGCHTDGTLVAIHSNAATTVAGTPRASCMVCHADGLPASADCTTCHADKVASHYNAAQHTATVASGTMIIQGVDLGSHSCSDCHESLELGTVHTGGCATCHPTPAASAKPWSGACATADCHTQGSTAPMHAGIDSAHNQPALLGGCEVGGCHDASGPVPLTGESIAEIHSDASTTVAGVTRTSCTICHSPGVTATNDCLTAGCHADRADPHGYNAAAHTGTPAAQTFSIGGAMYPEVACSNCHSTELGIEHTKSTSSGNTGCLECHAALVAALPQPWNRNTCAQGGCHTVASAARLHGSIDAAHVRLSANDACFASGCHAEATLAAIHSEATTTVAGVTRTSCMVCHTDEIPTSADCTTCHADKVASHYDAVQHTATFSSATITVLGASFGTHLCSECHATAELGVIHTAGCSTCHPDPAESAKPWDGNCATAGCHTVGSTAPMHGQIDPAHTIGSQTCTEVGCHAGSGNVAAIHTKEGCATCHGDGKTPTLTCTTDGCHTSMAGHGDVTATHASSVANGDVEFFDPSTNHAQSESGEVIFNVQCSMCHGVTNLLSLHGNDCSLCHFGSAPPRDSFTTWGGTCQQGNCHPSFHAEASPGHDWEYGNYTCDCHSYDTSTPNEEFCGSCHFIGPDTTPPTSSADALSSYSGTAAVGVSATDNKGVKASYYKLDGGAVREVGAGIVIVPPPSSGTSDHSLEFWSIDWAGNIELPHQFVDFSIEADITSPVTTSDAKSSYIGPAVIHLSATDNGTSFGIRTTYYRFDNGPVQQGTTATYPQPASGIETHTLYFWSVDYAGNLEPEHDATFTIQPDTVAPTTTSNLLPAPKWYPAGPITVSLTPIDPDPSSGVVGVHLDCTNPNAWWGDYHEAGWNSSLGVWQLKIWPQAGGSYPISWAARDNAGNVETTKTITVNVDINPPVTTSNITAGATYTGAQTFTLSPTDTGGSGAASTWWQLDSTSGTWNSGTSVSVAPPASGTISHTLFFYSRDNATNQETRRSVLFYVRAGTDTTPPTGSILIKGGTAWTNSTTTTLTLSATDGGSGVSQMRFSNDNTGWSTWETYGTSKTWAMTAGAGTKTVYVQFRDVAGNASGSFSDTIGVELTPPVTTSDIVSGSTYAGGQTFTLSPTDTGGSGVAGTWWQLDSTSGAWASGTSVPVAAPSSGTTGHTLYWYSRDTAGNQETTRSVSFSVQSAATVYYTLSYTAGANGSIVGSSTQVVLGNGSGASVTAQADPGFHFVRWSDGSTANPRTDSNVTGNVTVSAAFVADTGAQTTLQFRTDCSWYPYSGWDYAYWEVRDEGGNIIDSFWNDNPSHPEEEWWDIVVPAGHAYTMFGSYGPMENGPDVESATREVTASEAAAGATITWWWY